MNAGAPDEKSLKVRLPRASAGAPFARQAHKQVNRLDSGQAIGRFKDVFDFVLGTIGFLAAFPAMVVIAIIIKLDSDGPVLFNDWRLGQGGTTFKCYKFRTMHADGDDRLMRYLAENPEAQREWSLYKKLRGYDPRVTRVGRLLRRMSLDELPQLLNVLRGDMSLVGPRPYLIREESEMAPWRDLILTVRPGITGLWQVSGRNNLTFRQRLRLEAWYARHRTFLLDLWLLVKTVRIVLSRRGAH